MKLEISQHDEEIKQNLEFWGKKPVLRKIYRDFHLTIAGYISSELRGLIVEIGSGIGNIKEAIPGCIRTDLFPNPWIDQVENAYKLSFADQTVSHIVLFDVFHHLEYPGEALKEFYRVLCMNGRVIIFDPYISLLGFLIFGLFHHEPVSWGKHIDWFAPSHWSCQDHHYYASQGNMTRVFFTKKYARRLLDWNILDKRRMAAFSYVASGGYSKRQLYPENMLPIIKILDRMFDHLPWIFATRALVVLEKKA